MKFNIRMLYEEIETNYDIIAQVTLHENFSLSAVSSIQL